MTVPRARFGWFFGGDRDPGVIHAQGYCETSCSGQIASF